jgi:hypothetical protein
MPLRYHPSTCSPGGAIRTLARADRVVPHVDQPSPCDDSAATARTVTQRKPPPVHAVPSLALPETAPHYATRPCTDRPLPLSVPVPAWFRLQSVLN